MREVPSSTTHEASQPQRSEVTPLQPLRRQGRPSVAAVAALLPRAGAAKGGRPQRPQALACTAANWTCTTVNRRRKRPSARGADHEAGQRGTNGGGGTCNRLSTI
jgi:hypothetical protein